MDETNEIPQGAEEASEQAADVTAETPRTEQLPLGAGESLPAAETPAIEAQAIGGPAAGGPGEPAPYASPMPLSMPSFTPPPPQGPTQLPEGAEAPAAQPGGSGAGLPPGGQPPYPPPYGDGWSFGGPYAAASEPGGSHPRTSRKVLVAAVAGVALVAGGLGAGLGVAFSGSGSGGSGGGSGAGGVALLPRSTASSTSGSGSVGAVATAAEPAIVDINVVEATPAGEQAEEAAGTGMIVTSSGEVLTNNHVVEEATSIKVTIEHHSGSYTAKVLGVDPTKDVALIQIENPPADLPYLSLGNSSSVTLGQSVVAIGNALGLGGTPSIATGVVSALGRTIPATDEGSGATEILHGLIQTDAQIAPGDSGGPLLDSKGQVIGMDTAAASDDGEGGTLGFAIPINTAKTIVEEIEKGQASSTVLLGSSPFLGIWAAESGTGTSGGYEGNSGSSYSGLPGYGSPSGDSGSGTSVSGVSIEYVAQGGAAQKAGLAPGDVITAIDGKSTTTFSALQKVIASLKPGDKITVSFVNTSGATESASATLTALPK